MSTVTTVTTVSTKVVEPTRHASRRPVVTAGGVVVVAFLATCLLSWYLVQPGESLFGPTAWAIVIMGATSVGCYGAITARLGVRPRRIFLSLVAVLCVVSPLWASVGVLRVSLYLDASATRTAQTLIASKSTTCHIVNRGSVGLLRSPYDVCAKDYPGYGYRISFTTLDGGRGYAYIQGRSDVSWFPSQCAAHLYGDWWAFATSVNTSTGHCPMGFPENGAG